MRLIVLIALLALATNVLAQNEKGTNFQSYGVLYCGKGGEWCYTVTFWEYDFSDRRKRDTKMDTEGEKCTTEKKAFYHIKGSESTDGGTNKLYEVGAVIEHTCGGTKTKIDTKRHHSEVPFSRDEALLLRATLLD